MCDCPLGTGHGRHLVGKAAAGFAGFQRAGVLVAYLGELFWPVNLAVFYPHPLDALPAWKPAAALLVLLAVTAAVLVCWRRNPYLLVGWFWYLGMLVPVIGLVQIGLHAMADRYMYLPQIGLSIAVTWGSLYVVRSWPHRAWACGAAASLAIVALMACASQQTTYWRDSEALWTRDLECTSQNNRAHSNLAGELLRQGDFPRQSNISKPRVEIEPEDASSYRGLGDALLGLGKRDKSAERYEEAVAQYEKALRIEPEPRRGSLQSRQCAGASGAIGRRDCPVRSGLENRPRPRRNPLQSRLRPIEAGKGEAVDTRRRPTRLVPMLRVGTRSTGRPQSGWNRTSHAHRSNGPHRRCDEQSTSKSDARAHEGADRHC